MRRALLIALFATLALATLASCSKKEKEQEEDPSELMRLEQEGAAADGTQPS